MLVLVCNPNGADKALQKKGISTKHVHAQCVHTPHAQAHKACCAAVIHKQGPPPLLQLKAELLLNGGAGLLLRARSGQCPRRAHVSLRLGSGAG